MNGKPSILIVDDVELNRAFLGDMLEEGYTILEASNGLEAISLLKQYHAGIDIVLLDVIMPEMDGFEVLMVMNENHWIENIPVVMISAENSTDYITKGYELGAVDYINRPFDSNIIRRRIKNTIMLYAKQKSLQKMVADQIREKEQNNSLMIDILSTIVEFRNGESGLHVLRIRVITEILLETLSEQYPQYGLTPSMIAAISNAAALHDIGKVVIRKEILNKPGKLTETEYQEMRTHTVLGAQMLDEMRFGKGEELVQYARAICMWHHERWDGGGYPDGLKGRKIPISAQVVSLADVYDALVSTRVYKPAYSHNQAIAMILNRECGQFNPDLINCLIEVADSLEARIELSSDSQDKLFDIEKISKEVIAEKSRDAISDRTLFLLEQERTKYQFFAALSDEILFEYDSKEDTFTFSEKGSIELDVNVLTTEFSKKLDRIKIMNRKDIDRLCGKIKKMSVNQPFLQEQCLIKRPSGENVWYEITLRSMWTNDQKPSFLGVIGRMSNINEQKIETVRLKNLAERDSLTKLLNHMTAKRRIETELNKKPNQIAAMIFFDIDDFKCINDTRGHIFGDHILKYVAKIINENIRIGDVAARIGGDEFLIFLGEIHDQSRIEEQAKRICSALSGEYKDYKFSASMGISLYPKDGINYETLLDHADQALYACKKAGKNQYAFYNREGSSTVFLS